MQGGCGGRGRWLNDDLGSADALDIFHDWLNSLEIIVELIFNRRTTLAIFVWIEGISSIPPRFVIPPLVEQTKRRIWVKAVYYIHTDKHGIFTDSSIDLSRNNNNHTKNNEEEKKTSERDGKKVWKPKKRNRSDGRPFAPIFMKILNKTFHFEYINHLFYSGFTQMRQMQMLNCSNGNILLAVRANNHFMRCEARIFFICNLVV